MRSDEPDLGDALSPVDLPAPEAPLPHGLAWTSKAIAIATIFLAFTNAHALRDWAYQLPPTDYSAPVVTASEHWFDAMDSVGLNRPVETMHAAWGRLRANAFPAPPATGQAA